MGRLTCPIPISGALYAPFARHHCTKRKREQPPMLTEWQQIRFFPGYSVSDTGFVRNDDSGRVMSMLVNQSGVVNVGLTKNKIQYKRAVALLVAQAFLVPPRQESFDTPINLDGDRTNNNAENLVWRPKWFAVKYFRQFKDSISSPPMAVEEINTSEKFSTSWEAATAYGLLDRDIRVSVVARTEVWPTYQRFRLL